MRLSTAGLVRIFHTAGIMYLFLIITATEIYKLLCLNVKMKREFWEAEGSLKSLTSNRAA